MTSARNPRRSREEIERAREVRRRLRVYQTSPVKPRRRRSTKAELAEVDNAIREIARAEKPITIRGLFYRLVSRALVPKTDKADDDTPSGYGIVQREVLKMRREGRLPYRWITDGTRLRLEPETYTSAQAALENTARMYRRDLWIDQRVHVEIWCEKDAIRGVIYPVTAEYALPLMIARGYSSETFLYETAEEINAEGNPTVIYQLGDHDRDGVRAWNHIQRKLGEFVYEHIDLTFERIAVTEEQIIDLDLPTRPDKTDSGFGQCVEVDAIPTPILRELVSESIERHIDADQLAITQAAEESEREVLARIAGDMSA
jgi:hypothetical protein